MKQNIFLSIILSFLLCFINNEKVSAFESTNISMTPRVVDGEKAEISDFPYVASLRFRGNYLCVATCIGNADMIAPAQCFTHTYQDMWPYREVTIHTGTGNPRRDGIIYNIRKVSVHPGWTGVANRNHDLAHIKLAVGPQGIHFTGLTGMINLPSQDATGNAVGLVLGWGRHTSSGHGLSPKLTFLNIWTLRYTDCQTFYSFNFELEKEQLCSYNMQRVYTCTEEDRGGPLVIGNEVIGIQTWLPNTDCSNQGVEVFANIFSERDFLLPLIHQT